MKPDFPIQVHVPPQAVVRAMFEQCLKALDGLDNTPFDGVQTSALGPDELPAIGSTWNGGLYAGITVHDNKPRALILLPGEAENVKWQDAITWAEQRGAVLPSRFDSLVLFQNLKAEHKDAWYWTSEVHTGYADFAWLQYFGDGNQDYDHKGYDYRARAVRRVAI